MSDRDPFFELPFVKRGKGCNSNWAVHPTGDYDADCKTGEDYALAFLRLNDGTGGGWLQVIVPEMPLGDDDITGIEIAFLSTIDYAAVAGRDAAVRYCAHLERAARAFEEGERARRSEHARHAARARWAKHKAA